MIVPMPEFHPIGRAGRIEWSRGGGRGVAQVTGRCLESGVNMLVNQRRMAAVAMASWGLAGGAAFATPVTFYFGGEITRAVDTNGIFQGGIEVGDSFFARYTFELEQPDTVPADPNYGSYLGAVRAVSVRAGDITLTSPFGTIRIANDQFAGNDGYQVAGPLLFGDQPFDFALTLLDRDGEFVTSDALLAFPPSLILSETHQFSFTRQGTGVNIDGDLRLLSVVPEPATGVLALVGGMVAMLRRRKQGRCCACGNGYKP